jgi:O-antigen/teichoic acid export membrane protein
MISPLGSLLFLRHSRLWHDACLLLAVQTFYKLSGVILLVVLSRRLPAGDIGVYFFALSFAESFIVLASFQLNPVLMRRVAADPAQALAHLSPLLGFRLVSSPLYLLCVTVAAVALTGATWWVILVVALFALLENIYLAFGNFFLALKKAHYNVSIGVAVEVFFLAFFLLGMWRTPSLEVLLAGNLLRSACLVGTAVFATHRWLCPLQVSWDSIFIKEGAPFILLNLLAMLRGQVDTLLLGFLTDYDTVGHYHLALRIVFASSFVPATVGLVLFPQLAAHGLSKENRRTVVCAAGLLLGLGLLGTAVIFPCAAPLTAVLYGSLAEAVTPLLRLLALLFPLTFLNLFLAATLQALHQETKTLAALAVGTGMGFLANGALIPLFGADGAAYARVLSALIQLGLLIRCLWPLVMQQAPLTARQQERGTLALPVASVE